MRKYFKPMRKSCSKFEIEDRNGPLTLLDFSMNESLTVKFTQYLDVLKRALLSPAHTGITDTMR